MLSRGDHSREMRVVLCWGLISACPPARSWAFHIAWTGQGGRQPTEMMGWEITEMPTIDLLSLCSQEHLHLLSCVVTEDCQSEEVSCRTLPRVEHRWSILYRRRSQVLTVTVLYHELIPQRIICDVVTLFTAEQRRKNPPEFNVSFSIRYVGKQTQSQNPVLTI